MNLIRPSIGQRCFIVWAACWALLSAGFLLSWYIASDLSAPHRYLGIALGIVAATFPSVGSLLVLGLIPLFGNRPGSMHAESLAIVACFINIGLLASLCRGEARERLSKYALHPLSVLAACVCATTLVSLTGLPLAEWFTSVRTSVPSNTDLSGLAYRAHRILASTEERLDYSLLSVFILISGFHFFLQLLISTRPRALLLTTLASLTASLIFGLLDYYGAINLLAFRDLDPVVNPGGAQFRIQSFFGHSGWFAEYVTLAIPSALVILALPLPFRLRIAILLALLLLGEFVLILTFQRGGWLSYPLTLIAIWTAVYLIYLFEKGVTDPRLALKRSLLKILISLPLTVALSLALIIGLNRFNLLGPDARSSLDSYTQRFKDISQTKDRSDFMRAGFKLGSLSPLVGLGSESFAYSYRRYFKREGAPFQDQIILPLHGSAHNVYFQTFAGKGTLGLAALFALLSFAIAITIRKSFMPKSLAADVRLSALAACCFFIAFLVYGNVQEVFYVQALVFLFFGFVALGVLTTPEYKAPLILAKCGFALIILIGILHLVLYAPSLGTFTPPPTYGCYDFETDEAQRRYRWCNPRAQVAMPVVTQENGRKLLVSLEAAPYSGSAHTVQIFRGDSLILEQVVAPGQGLKKELDTTSEEAYEIIKIRTAGYVIPHRDLPPSKDRRALAFKLYH